MEERTLAAKVGTESLIGEEKLLAGLSGAKRRAWESARRDGGRRLTSAARGSELPNVDSGVDSQKHNEAAGRPQSRMKH